MNIVKVISNPRVLSALVSAVSAIICVVFAGCALHCGEFGIKDFESELFTTNTIPFVK